MATPLGASAHAQPVCQSAGQSVSQSVSSWPVSQSVSSQSVVGQSVSKSVSQSVGLSVDVHIVSGPDGQRQSTAWWRGVKLPPFCSRTKALRQCRRQGPPGEVERGSSSQRRRQFGDRRGRLLATMHSKLQAPRDSSPRSNSPPRPQLKQTPCRGTPLWTDSWKPSQPG